LRKENLRIVIVDDSKFYCKALEMMLKKCGFKNIEKFQNPMQFLSYFRTNNKKVDIVLIDYRMPDIDGLEVLDKIKKIRKNILTVMITIDKEVELKQKAIEKGINEFVNKDISFPEFKAKMDILSNIRLFQYKEAQKNIELNKILQYKDDQESKAVSKQLQIIKDQLSFHYFDDITIQSYFQPLDVLSGDSYSALNLEKEDKFLIVLADAMGKGLSASISSILAIAYANHKATSLIDRNDYIYELFVKNLFEYIQSIMLENEALCLLIFEYDRTLKKIRYANFGIPPILMKNLDGKVEKIKTNNLPIMKNGNSKYRIDEINSDFKTLLLTTDGLIENSDINGVPYLIHLKEIFQKADSLNEIINDYKQKCDHNEDDITIFFIKKEGDEKFEKIVDDTVLLSKDSLIKYTQNLDKILSENNIEAVFIDKIIFIISELLMNCYEHGYLCLQDKKQEHLEKEKELDPVNSIEYANVQVLKNSKYILIKVLDNGEGFDVNEVLKRRNVLKNELHGRGIKMISTIADGIFFNKKGNHLKTYISLKRS